MTSFAPILNGLGLKCQFIEDPIGTERLKSRVPPRNASYVRTMPAAAGILFTARMLNRIRRIGGMARMAKLTPEQRSELGKKAAAARWKKGAIQCGSKADIAHRSKLCAVATHVEARPPDVRF